MKIVIFILLAAGVGYWGGSSLAISEAQKSLAAYLQSPEGVQSCREIVREAGG